MNNGNTRIPFDFTATEENASTISEVIRDLKNCQPNEFWDKVKDINNLFKELKPLKREDREQLWAEFQSLIDLRKNAQEKIADHSKALRDHILVLISRADGKAGVAENASQFADANDELQEAMSMMKDGWHGGNWIEGLASALFLSFFPEAKLLKSDREQCFEKWHQAKETLKNRREQIYERNFDRVMSAARSAFNVANVGDPYEALDAVKSVNTELKDTEMFKPQQEEIRSYLEDVWQKAISRIEAMKDEKRRKQEEWERRQEDHIQRWSEIIERKQDQISRLEDNIRRNEDKYGEATGDFASVVEGWISEGEQKIRELTADIGNLERKISDVQSKLNQ
ncbi:MAG: hypothetical protein WC650_05120 [Candidatus Doudnabacteria bacterium]